MKILQVAPYFMPYKGGQEFYVQNLCKHLVEHGHEIHIITSDFPKETQLKLSDGITIDRYPVVLRILRNPIIPDIYKIRKRLNEFDVVHVHNEHSFPAMIMAFLRIKYKFPLIITQHGQLIFGNFFLDLIEKIYTQSIGKFIFRRADKIICLSNSDKKYVSKFINKMEKIEVMPNAIDKNLLSTVNKNSIDLISKYGIKEKKIVLFVGQLIKRKGVDYLIKAIPHILKKSQKRNFVFLIIGTGDFLNTVRQIAENLKVTDFIIFTNNVSFSELIQAYECSDVYVLPSLSEGLPTTILEAMYFGLPVVATDIPGVRDHFKHYALLVPPKDEKKLADAIVQIINNVELAKTKSIEGKNLIETKYTWEIVANEYCKVYKKLINDMRQR